jgi:two-component system nitrogen regulation sensor histidine kinase NtrY
MPEPVMAMESLSRCVQDSLTLQRQAHPEIDLVYSESLAAGTCQVWMDARQIRQAMTNLIQNAIESITQSSQSQGKGHIRVLVGNSDHQDFVAISDSGPGFPTGDVAALLEPYVTHKAKGTGLGLAIVKKIMEDHNGGLVLGAPDWMKSVEGWQDLGGATVVLLFPRQEQKAVA